MFTSAIFSNKMYRKQKNSSEVYKLLLLQGKKCKKKYDSRDGSLVSLIKCKMSFLNQKNIYIHRR